MLEIFQCWKTYIKIFPSLQFQRCRIDIFSTMCWSKLVFVEKYFRKKDHMIVVHNRLNLMATPAQLPCLINSRPPYPVLEYAPFGNLRNFLRSQRDIEDEGAFKTPRINIDLKFVFCRLEEIADGMAYLSKRGVLYTPYPGYAGAYSDQKVAYTYPYTEFPKFNVSVS